MSTWRQRFALSTYDNRWQEYFCASRCVEDRKTYLAVRVCLFLTVLAVFIWSVAHHPSRCYLIYLTNQMLIIEVVYLAFAGFVGLLLCFDVLRGRLWWVYEPRTHHDAYRLRTPRAPGRRWFAWLRQVFALWSDEDFLIYAGVDGLASRPLARLAALKVSPAAALALGCRPAARRPPPPPPRAVGGVTGCSVACAFLASGALRPSWPMDAQ